MLRAILLLAALAPVLAAEGPRSDAPPSYSEASIVNAASHAVGPFAPCVIATIFGGDLARETAAVSDDDVARGSLPDTLAHVRVRIGESPQVGRLAGLFYVSPQQINFLIPGSLHPGLKYLAVVREGVTGPAVALRLEEAAPAPFLAADSYEVIASHLDYTLITPDAPARPGEWVVLWAGGLGATEPKCDDFLLPRESSPLAERATLHIFLAGQEVDPARINYAGLAPGLPGLYQINLLLPEELTADPELRIDVSGVPGPTGLVLHVR